MDKLLYTPVMEYYWGNKEESINTNNLDELQGVMLSEKKKKTKLFLKGYILYFSIYIIVFLNKKKKEKKWRTNQLPGACGNEVGVATKGKHKRSLWYQNCSVSLSYSG